MCKKKGYQALVTHHNFSKFVVSHLSFVLQMWERKSDGGHVQHRIHELYLESCSHAWTRWRRERTKQHDGNTIKHVIYPRDLFKSRGPPHPRLGERSPSCGGQEATPEGWSRVTPHARQLSAQVHRTTHMVYISIPEARVPAHFSQMTSLLIY